MAISLQTGAADDGIALGDDDRANEVKAVRESIRSYRSGGLSMAIWVPVYAISDKMRIVEYLKSIQSFE
jgi:hypothetical protein